MKFQSGREGEWRAYSNPFTFWIFDYGDQFDVVWHYGDETGTLILPSFDKAKEWCHEFALTRTLNQLQEIAPEKGRVEIIDSRYKFVCNGAVPDMGYWCCLDIGHQGDCYTNVKKVYFKREN